MSKTSREKYLLLLFSISITTVLASCTNTNSAIDVSNTEISIENESMNSGTLAIPEDFPSDIPIQPGKIVVSSTAGESNARTWVVEVLVDDLKSARLKVMSDLKQSNFVLLEESGIGTTDYLATLSNPKYSIRLKVYLESDTGEKEIRYVVTKK